MNKQIIVLATRNYGKTKEIKNLLDNSLIQIKDLNDFGPIPEVKETGKTFDENAYIKASFAAKVLGLPAMADDSGLIVDALDGKPGVNSARYGGESATDKEKCLKILNEMKSITNRKASFECVISIAIPTGPALTYEASCKGIITQELIGNNGFGYDPIFYYEELNKTFAAMTPEEKSSVSHRGKALRQVKNEIEKIIKWLNIQIPKDEKFNAGNIYCSNT